MPPGSHPQNCQLIVWGAAQEYELAGAPLLILMHSKVWDHELSALGLRLWNWTSGPNPGPPTYRQVPETSSPPACACHPCTDLTEPL